MNSDLASGIKNALERGDTLERVMQSFVNAGYNPQEVMAASKMISEGSVTNLAYPGAVVSGKKDEAKKIFPPLNPAQSTTKKSSSHKILLIAAIVVTALVFLGAAGYLYYLLYMK